LRGPPRPPGDTTPPGGEPGGQSVSGSGATYGCRAPGAVEKVEPRPDHAPSMPHRRRPRELARHDVGRRRGSPVRAGAATRRRRASAVDSGAMPTAHQVSTTLEVSPDAGRTTGGDAVRRGPSRDPQELLEGLNGPQVAAVTHTGSPLLIVAGAGSGKTRVLTHRIAYLLAARDVHPGEILAITVPNKAAGEMKDRVAALVGRRARMMWVSTFHSACVRILRAEHAHAGLKSTFSIYDADDSRRLMQLVTR